MESFTASVSFDQRLYHFDIEGSIAHANMLAAVGILTENERDSIVSGLQEIHKEIDEGRFEWQVTLEDVHMNIESRLVELIGDTGKKLHTGRSRNDQVATDIRLYLRDEIDALHQHRSRTPERAAGSCREARRYHHARLHPSATGSTHHLRPSPAGMVRDAAARSGTPGRLPSTG